MNKSKTRRILVVDDDPYVIDLISRFFAGDGIWVETAHNGEAAKEKIAEHQFDLLITDIQMLVMSGIELYHWLQEKHPRLADRVIFISGSVGSEDTHIFLKQVGRPYLAKPFVNADLITIVRETMPN